MKTRLRFPAVLAGTVAIVAVAISMTQSQAEQGGADIAANPLLQEWSTPFGVPPFGDIKDEHYLPAFREAMKRHKVEIDAIVAVIKGAL